MERRAKVELFEQIRREYEFGAGTIRGVAQQLGVHRRLVRQALADAVPRQRATKERPRPKIGPLVEFIDGILEADRRAPRKQRHSAHRIWVRITKERAGRGHTHRHRPRKEAGEHEQGATNPEPGRQVEASPETERRRTPAGRIEGARP